jgi:UDP-N-acetylmuramyl pentapeptide phosphotransferase/UDP-N-acetylglucosamine-1-phosphate transferase
MGKTGKITTIFLWVLLVVSAVLVVSLIANINEEVETDPTMLSWVNSNLVWAYILVALGAGVAVLAGLYQTVTDKKKAKGGIISLVFLGVVAVISYMMASSEIPQFIGVDKFVNDGTLTESIAKMVDTGLYATYILLGLAILSTAASSVMRLFR